MGKQETRVGSAVQTATTYGDFREHPFFLCTGCQRKWDMVARTAALVAVAALTITLIVIAIRAHQAWLFAAALVIFIVGMAPASHLNVDAKLSKKALRERGAAIKGFHAFIYTGETDNFKSFNEKEFARLQKR
jgi:hypothetical protein